MDDKPTKKVTKKKATKKKTAKKKKATKKAASKKSSFEFEVTQTEDVEEPKISAKANAKAESLLAGKSILPEEEIPKNPVGKQTILTEELIDKVVRGVKTGAFIHTIFKMHGVSPRSYHHWLKLGSKLVDGDGDDEELKKINPLYGEFTRRVREAEAQMEMVAVGGIVKAGQSNWNAYAWWLTRKFPDRWAQSKIALEHSGEVTENKNITVDQKITIEAKIADRKKIVEKIHSNPETLEATFKVLESIGDDTSFLFDKDDD